MKTNLCTGLKPPNEAHDSCPLETLSTHTSAFARGSLLLLLGLLGDGGRGLATGKTTGAARSNETNLPRKDKSEGCEEVRENKDASGDG